MNESAQQTVSMTYFFMSGVDAANPTLAAEWKRRRATASVQASWSWAKPQER
jgi:hypothetical protein